MATDLTVPEGQVVVFDDDAEPSLQTYLEKVPVETLDDLVTNGLVSSHDHLASMLDAAREVTDTSLRSISSTREVPLVAGSGRMDLGRYRPFAIRTSDVSESERDGFWRIFRAIPSSSVTKVTTSTKLKDLGLSRVQPVVIAALFKDVTIEAGATLTFAGKVKKMSCGDLLIKRTGRIKVVGSGLVIKAGSIKGEQ